MTALRGGRVWRGDGSAAEPLDVMLDGERIAAVAPSLGGDGLDLAGCTVLPGLIEAHAHLCFDATPGWRATYDSDTPGRMLLRMAASGRSMLEAGITTVRDLGAPTETAIEIREAFRSGLALGPDLLISGAPITTTGGHCWFMGGEADGELAIRRAVRERVKAGADWIKVMATGGNMTARTNTFEAQFTVEELTACVQEAHRLHRRVAAHAHGAKGVRVAVAAGVDSIEHCTFSTPGGIDFDESVAKEMAAKGIVVSPTVSIGYRRWPDDGQRQRRATVLRGLLDAGCRVIASTDCGIPNVAHAELAGGLELLQELSGLHASQVLQLATSESAAILGLSDRGVVAEGRRADLLVVEGDPATDLGALRNVRYVFKAGQLVYRSGHVADRH